MITGREIVDFLCPAQTVFAIDDLTSRSHIPSLRTFAMISAQRDFASATWALKNALQELFQEARVWERKQLKRIQWLHSMVEESCIRTAGLQGYVLVVSVHRPLLFEMSRTSALGFVWTTPGITCELQLCFNRDVSTTPRQKPSLLLKLGSGDVELLSKMK